MTLTKKQEAFVMALVEGKSQRRAYREAYPNFKGTDKSADEKASKLFNTVKIRERFDEINQKVIAEAEEQSIMTAVDVIRELASIANDNIANYVDFRTEKTVVGKDGNGNPVAEYSTVYEVKDSRTVDTRNISEITVTKDGTFRCKMYSRLDALEKLGKYLGMFDKRPQDNAQSVNDIASNMLSLAQLLSSPLPNRELPDDE